MVAVLEVGAVIQIPRRHPTELPTEAGFYLVEEAGVSEPQIFRWSAHSTRWQYPRSVATPPIVGWLGPIRRVPDAFGGAR